MGKAADNERLRLRAMFFNALAARAYNGPVRAVFRYVDRMGSN